MAVKIAIDQYPEKKAEGAPQLPKALFDVTAITKSSVAAMQFWIQPAKCSTLSMLIVYG